MSDRTGARERTGSVDLTWPAHPRSLADLRAAVRGWLAPLGFSDDTAEDIVLAVNEAAANTIDHAYPGTDPAHLGNTVGLHLWISDFAAHLEIVDQGRWRPPRPEPSGRGFGIVIMHRLVDAVFIQHGPAGTAVLLRHRLPINGARLTTHRA